MCFDNVFPYSEKVKTLKKIWKENKIKSHKKYHENHNILFYKYKNINKKIKYGVFHIYIYDSFHISYKYY